MRHRSIAMPLAMLASLAVASVALAGGWAQVTAKQVPVDPPAGEETAIHLDVRQHGVTPVSWPDVTVIATEATSGAVVRAEAQAEGAPGSYVARIVFPSAGEWTLTFESVDLVMAGSVALNIAPSVAAAPGGAGTPTEIAPVAPTSNVTPWLFALLAGAVVLAVAGLALRRRGAPADTRLSART